MSVIHLPLRGPARMVALKNALRLADPRKLDTGQIVTVCQSALPDCTREEIIGALREIGDEQIAEAERLERGTP